MVTASSIASMSVPRLSSVLPDVRRDHTGTLTVHIKRAKNLVAMDKNGLSGEALPWPPPSPAQRAYLLCMRVTCAVYT
jgi:hypothetical protein